MQGGIPVQIRPVKIKIVKATDETVLENEVNKLLADGYLFHGELKALLPEGELTYIQSMVKTETFAMEPPRGHSSNILIPQ